MQQEASALSALSEEASGAFERGLRWILRMEPEMLGAESRMMALSGLLLIDPQRVPPVRKALAPPQGHDPIAPFFAAVEASPLPIPWDEPNPFQRYIPDALPATLQDRQGFNAMLAHGGLAQGTRGRLEEPVLSWLRQEGLWGYDLNHQLLSWILCLKGGHRVEEARERVLRFGARLWREHDDSPFEVFYDLYVESTVFLVLAGVPMERLAGKFRTILSSQDADGGWWFTRDPSEFGPLMEGSHLGASPLYRPPRHYSEEADPELALRSLSTLHRAHSTALSLWGLGLLLQRQGAQAT